MRFLLTTSTVKQLTAKQIAGDHRRETSRISPLWCEMAAFVSYYTANRIGSLFYTTQNCDHPSRSYIVKTCIEIPQLGSLKCRHNQDLIDVLKSVHSNLKRKQSSPDKIPTSGSALSDLESLSGSRNAEFRERY